MGLGKQNESSATYGIAIFPGKHLSSRILWVRIFMGGSKILGDQLVDGLVRAGGGRGSLGSWLVGGGVMEFREVGDYVWVNGMVRYLGGVRFSGLIRGELLGVSGDGPIR